MVDAEALGKSQMALGLGFLLGAGLFIAAAVLVHLLIGGWTTIAYLNRLAHAADAS
jgi:hypothetical protein